MIWFIGKFCFSAPNLLSSYGWKPPLNLSEIWVFVSTCIPVASELLGECPRSLGKGRVRIWCCSSASVLGRNSLPSPPACPPRWGLKCLALSEVFPLSHICSAGTDERKILSSVSDSAALIWNPALVQWAPSRAWGDAIKQRSSFSAADSVASIPTKNRKDRQILKFIPKVEFRTLGKSDTQQISVPAVPLQTSSLNPTTSLEEVAEGD